MMWGEQLPPAAFLRAEKRTRRWYHFHTRTRVWRHPLRTRRRRKAQGSARQYPHPRDFWIWDDRSMQAIPAMRSRDRRRYYRKRDALGQLKALACRGRAIRREFRTLLDEAWTRPVDMAGRVAVAINAEAERFPQEREFLARLGPVPTHVRLYHHADPGQRRAAIEAVRVLHGDGHEVSIAFVQDRRAVLHPRAWQAFVEDAAGSLSGFVSWAEAGHAINRVKWGVWDLPEYAGLLSAFANWKDRFPQIPLTGPAGIDFEVARVLPLLDQLPPGLCFDAFSHHMYVDRRGAPENFQGRFDTLGKLALLRAVARTHPACADRLIVSEVNWPLQGTGEWSPVGSPWVSPGPRRGDPSVDEDLYAAYMLRYLLIALCSGMAERVVWWNLAAHGFGLIDDRDPQGWRERPAFGVLQRFLRDMNGARFVGREADAERTAFRFAHAGGDFLYAHSAGQPLALRIEA